MTSSHSCEADRCKMDGICAAEQKFIQMQTAAIVAIVCLQMLATLAVGAWINSHLTVTPEEVRASTKAAISVLERRLDGDPQNYPPRLQRILDAVDHVGSEVSELRSMIISPDEEVADP